MRHSGLWKVPFIAWPNLILVRRRSADLRHVLLTHAVDFEAAGGGDHLVHHLVEVELGRLREPDGIDAGDDEWLEIRAGQAALLERGDDLRDRIVELQDLPR